ncbi:MAG: DUF2911 domain-containing protein, partial [Gemmatimonadales bacterium]
MPHRTIVASEPTGAPAPPFAACFGDFVQPELLSRSAVGSRLSRYAVHPLKPPGGPMRLRFLLTAALAASFATVSAAQNVPLTLPRQSQGATVSQTIGLTDVSVSYHRPVVNGRKVWGALVPFDAVWRGGANENTVLTVTSPFTIGGTSLPAGRYGLHFMPTATSWTLILSRQANNWGSFSYHPSEDAARVPAATRSAEFLEHLQYSMEDPSDTSVTLTMHWE